VRVGPRVNSVHIPELYGGRNNPIGKRPERAERFRKDYIIILPNCVICVILYNINVVYVITRR